MDRVQKFLMWTLRSRVSPLAYLFGLGSLAVSIFFTFFPKVRDVVDSPVTNGFLTPSSVWGVGLLFGSVVLLVGLAKNNVSAVKAGSMLNFILWIFACLIFVHSGHWYLLVTFGSLHALAQGYLYLISSIDSLWESRCIFDFAKASCPREVLLGDKR